MKNSCGSTSPARRGERGQGRLKFLIVLTIIGVIGYVIYQYVPVAYDAYLLKDFMQHEVDVAAAQGYKADWVKQQVVRKGPEYNMPSEATVEPVLKEGRMEVRVNFTRQIPLPGYVYDYNFNHTAKSTQFLIAP
jgi:hypothetical protein